LNETFTIPLEKDMKKYPKESVKGTISFHVEQNLMTGNESLFEGTFSTLKNVAKSMRAEGWRPKNPVVIIPGIYGSALEVWTGSESLFGKRIWVTIQGMGMDSKNNNNSSFNFFNF
jgi:3-mercaptopyruvate sulfurtransferase SseA